MRTETAQFLKKIKQSWKLEFPCMAPVDLKEVPARKKGGNYICDKYFAERGVVYFFSLEVHHVRKTDVTIDVTISDSATRSVRDGRWSTPLDPQKNGTFRLGMFVNGKDCWWALADADAEHNTTLKSLGFETIPAQNQGVLNRWTPPSFDLPVEQIMDAAVADINDKLRRFVLPVLRIDIH